MASRTPKTLAERLTVKPGSKVDLGRIDPREAGFLGPEEAARAKLKDDAKAIDELQDRLYGEKTRALLVILQGIDTSGKDGTVRSVFNATGPLGVSVQAFGKPSEEELEHDYLWRVHRSCPRRGTIGIFNRSHYEDVLVGRVRKLASAEAIERRYGEINDFERMLVQNGTVILKFMLLISKAEQGERLKARLDEIDKRWKFNPGDLEDRAHWDDYMKAYEIMLERCSSAHAPWMVIPADRKWARNCAIAAIVRATLETMDPCYPTVTWDPKDFSVT